MKKPHDAKRREGLRMKSSPSGKPVLGQSTHPDQTKPWRRSRRGFFMRERAKQSLSEGMNGKPDRRNLPPCSTPHTFDLKSIIHLIFNALNNVDQSLAEYSPQAGGSMHASSP